MSTSLSPAALLAVTSTESATPFQFWAQSGAAPRISSADAEGLVAAFFISPGDDGACNPYSSGPLVEPQEGAAVHKAPAYLLGPSALGARPAPTPTACPTVEPPSSAAMPDPRRPPRRGELIDVRGSVAVWREEGTTKRAPGLTARVLRTKMCLPLLDLPSLASDNPPRASYSLTFPIRRTNSGNLAPWLDRAPKPSLPSHELLISRRRCGSIARRGWDYDWSPSLLEGVNRRFPGILSERDATKLAALSSRQFHAVRLQRLRRGRVPANLRGRAWPR
ncbi:hypothetical protein THAOC_33987 [Thalassiosira oceanica]|uniref:Uncharacterized protein n=1 Tax=Thalassiosira oceanica TaxID=159749 RepID=K0R5X9_THAOC|nr:hypothetical protein THAOC_33987 [Thalassiosira oceanica]|eukprot:EJK47304.1 hypothetical protein THAOC_33987 [Thalassiosira oceanica]